MIRICTTLCIAVLLAVATMRAGDTVTVKTLTFGDITKRSGTWLFPPAQRYEKILMEYTLKCDPLTTHDKYDCGEWDYLTYIFLTDSTGTVDSTRLNTPLFKVHRIAPATFTYADVASAATLQPDTVRVTAALSAIRIPTSTPHKYSIGSGSLSLAPFTASAGFRSQFLWTAQELVAAGLKKGFISRIALQGSTQPFSGKDFVVRMRQDSAARLNTLNPDAAVWQEVYRYDTVLLSATEQTWLDMYTYFTWDGKSDILVDISAASVTSGSVALMATAGGSGTIMMGNAERPGLFDEGDEIVVPASVFTNISNEVSVMFWCKGDTARQPRASSVFEAWDAQGRRVLNAHLPWDNGRVYWDAGITPADGSSDRVEQDAPATSWEGRWNHWAFVKNATTGTMQVYLNGSMFMQRSGATKSMNGIARFSLGSGSAGSFPGALMHLAIVNKALDSAAIRSVMTSGRSGSPLTSTNMLAYYAGFPGGANRVLTDVSGGGRDARLFGLPTLTTIDPIDQPLGIQPLTMRPNIGFDQDTCFGPAGAMSRKMRSVALPLQYTDIVRNSRPIQRRIYHEDSIAALSQPTDTLLVIECNPMLLSYSGATYQTKPRNATPPILTMTNGDHTFFSRIVNFEIGRYITPYGIGLSLGNNGFKWVFDVSDYAQLLHDNVTLSAGNQQELIDVTFKMIKGTPPRDVTQLDQIYSVRDGSYAEMVAGRLLKPEVVSIEPASVTHRLKTRTTGHRFGAPSNCAEFCQRNHQLFVDGTKRFEWLLWNECASNPVYPQGGTWNIDRAGWCPGAPVDVYDHEATPFARDKDAILVDYGVEGDQWNGSQGVWDVTTQFVGYGAPNHKIDVSIEEVLAPTNWEFYHRINPICGEPIVVLRNTGAMDVTTCTITYGAEGGPMRTYTWNGVLKFLERDTLTLPAPTWPSTGTQHTFVVSTSLPNGGTDEYADNNKQEKQFTLPPMLYRDFEIVLRTNRQAAAQYNWSLRKIGGDTINSGKNLADNTTYNYKHTLDDGCYEFVLNNVEGYGLDLWFLRADLGTGSLAFKSLNNTIKTFNSDFGNTAWMQFRVGDKPTIATNTDTLVFNYPTLEQSTRQLLITPANPAGLHIDSISVFHIRKYFTIVSTSRPLPLDLAHGDTIAVTVAFLRDALGTSSGTLRIHSNDERQPAKIVKLIGAAGSTSVDDEDGRAGASGQSGPELQVIPNPSDGNATIILDRVAHIRVFDALGALVFEQTATPESMHGMALPQFVSGSYTIVASVGNTRSTALYVVVR